MSSFATASHLINCRDHPETRFIEVMVNVRELVTSRPIVVFCVLAVVVVVIGCISISIWQTITENVVNDVASFSEDLRSSLVSQIENIGNFTYPKTKLSSIRLANAIDTYLTNNDTGFTQIHTQIAPLLFEVYSMIPQVSQVSYISKDGLLFSYMAISNTIVAVFANSSSGGDYTWYTQTVNQITGHLNGKATKSQPLDVTDTDWFEVARRDHSTAFVGTGLGGEDKETLFQNVVSLQSKKGVVLLGLPIKTLTGILNRLNLLDGELYLWTTSGTVLFPEGSLHHASFFISNGSICFGHESASVKSQCIPENCSSSGYKVEMEGSEFKTFCSVINVSGVPLRYTLMFPNKGGAIHIKHKAEEAMYLHISVTMFVAFGWPIGFVWFMLQATRKEMHMRATLISQMEATQQAERKSLNKSQAFARASHDIRGALAGITGLIGLCRDEVNKLGSDLDTSLKQVNVCTKDLVALLNSVLDMSKIESGKMQLEEEDFNLASLLEDVIDFYHPVAMKKGVDLVLDLHDDSIFKFSNVRGDSGKLKQILNNLISNAVKFTVDGHISIRAWAQRPGPKSSVVLASEPQGRTSKLLKRMLCKTKDQSSMYETEALMNPIRNNANTMEFVFEVDDTGKGIPMEMRKSVFENYVQVRETAQGQQGTGLGLGIVQSLVRLMRGEIRITDKAMGEKGTCFQFNVLLTTLESSGSDLKVRHDIEAKSDCISTPNLGPTINTSLGGSKSIRKLSPRFNNCLTSSPKQESSRVVLLLKSEERKRVTERYIKNLGIKVTVVEKWEHLSHDLERLFGVSPQSSMERAEFSFRNELSSCPSSRELPLIGMDGVDSRSQTPRRRSNSLFGVVLLVIDAKAGPYSELYNIVEQFRRGLQHGISCKVIWLNESSTRGSERGDISCSKPLHGSRLIQVLKMLPEFGGTEETETPTELQQRHSPVAETSSKHTEIEEEELSSRFNKRLGKTIIASSETETVRTENPEDKQGTSKPINNELLRGRRVLVVDDNIITSSVAARKLKKMGVSEVKQCDSGKEAVKLVNECLTQRLPFDYIFMDCQMPEMDGYEATRHIRKVEREYGAHIPIIAVSGHDPGSKEARETIEAGMDAFLEKDMNQDQLAIIIRDIHSKMTLQGSL